MNKPKRVQLSRKKGWRMPPNTVSVARPTKWGNPFGWQEKHGPNRQHAVDAFQRLPLGKPTLRRHMMLRILKGNQGAGEARVAEILTDLPSLRGKNLACWCPLDQPCHADVLLELANKEAGDGAG